MIKTKRILALLLSAAMTISLLPTFTLTASADALTPLTDSESGTTLSDTDGDGAYEIGTKADLIAFSNLVNAGNTTINAKVTADIEFNSEEVMDGFTVTPNKVTPPASAERFTPIGKSTALLTRGATAWGLTYRGTFDGDNHTISGIYVGDPGAANSAKADIDGTYARGLFGYVGPQGVVKNLKVKNSCIYGNYSTGGIVGCLVCGTVENCSYTDGSVYGIVENLTGESGTGGIVGVATLCRLSESLSTDKNDVGAVAGILDCISEDVTFSGNGRGYGGIAGYAKGNRTATVDLRARIVGCTANNSIQAISNTYISSLNDEINVCIGGIVGHALYCYMESCVNNGDIRQSNHAQNIGKYVGGIAGWYELGEIISCENNGAVICAQKADNVGGIAGLTRGYTVGMNTTYNASAIKGCWNTGNISTSGSYAGGIVGANHYSSSDTADMYMNCYNLGDITGADYVGGIAGAVRNRRSTALTRVHTCYTFGKVECTDGTGNVGAVAGLANQTGMLGKNFWNTSKYSGTAVGSGTAGSANKGAAPDVFESGEIAWSLQSSQTETDDSGAKK